MKRFFHLVCIVFVILIISPFSVRPAAARLQAETPRERAQALLETLSPEERVGQLFMVTFEGPEAGPRSQIYNLVTENHIGGVVLLASNDNFKALDQTLPIANSLTRSLQLAEYNASQLSLLNLPEGTNTRPAFIPLFIAVSQDGDGYPYDQIIGDMAYGLTPLPSPMAIGATWKPELAARVGTVLGSELASLGINLLLGPSLDVLESPHTGLVGDIGVRSFGSSPYWVGEMGKAFIAGVHSGSGGEMAVIAKHFPGYGSSDRLPEEDVATVRKTLDELKQTDMVPFFAVTGDAPSVEEAADGLLIPHIRYQGFQGNIRPATRPVTLDSRAISQLNSMAPISEWRSNDGILISDDLGSRALRLYYQSIGQSFIGKFVARNAFLAGNDLLYIGNFSSDDEPDSYTSILRTLELFVQSYYEDSLFAQRVDESVLRILTLKYKIYGNTFSLTRTRAPASLPNNIGTSTNVTFEVAQNAATLLSPDISVLSETLPEPPGRNDRIVFITDNRLASQCSTCPIQSVFGVNAQEAVKALQNVVIRLYSPQAGGQVLPGNLRSFEFTQLQELLDVGPGIHELEPELRQATWIVFVTINTPDDTLSAQTLHRLLNERPDLIQQKHIVVFALSAPYYIDATDISKVSAFYALYSKAPRFLDVAARLLFQEITPQGFSPVSVPAVGYSVEEILRPDPAQDIRLEVDDNPAVNPSGTATPLPTVEPDYEIGDQIPIRTSPINDHNGHLVPDQTIVRFLLTRSEGGVVQASQIIDSPTEDGIARAYIRIDGPGVIQVHAESGSARSSIPLQFNVLAEPTQVVGQTFTPTPTLTTTPSLTPTFSPTPRSTPVVPPPPPEAGLQEWFLAFTITLIIGVVTYWVASMMGQMRWGLRAGMLTLIGGLLAYSYLALQMPGTEGILDNAGSNGIVGITLLGIGLGWGVAWGWKGIQELRHAN